MSEFRFSYPACAIAGKDNLVPQDIAVLKDVAVPMGVQCEADIVALLAINNSCRNKCPEWTGYFVDSIAAFLLKRLPPEGLVDDAKAGIVQRLFSTRGLIRSAEELALVLALLERSQVVPENLAAFALDQLRLALQFRTGAYAETRPEGALGITATDLHFVERIISATLIDDERISPIIATVLEGIDSVSAAPFNHPVWRDLMNLVNGVAPQRKVIAKRYTFSLSREAA